MTTGTARPDRCARPADPARVDTFAEVAAAEPGCVWLVRPDGHVAAHVRPADAGAARAAILDR